MKQHLSHHLTRPIARPDLRCGRERHRASAGVLRSAPTVSRRWSEGAAEVHAAVPVSKCLWNELFWRRSAEPFIPGWGQAPAARLHWAPAAAGRRISAGHGRVSGSPACGNRVRTPAVALGVELNEEQLFSDLYSMEQSVEPRATAPIHELFEDAAGDGGTVGVAACGCSGIADDRDLRLRPSFALRQQRPSIATQDWWQNQVTVDEPRPFGRSDQAD